MNKIWSSIIIFSFIYAIATNNLTTLIDNILNVPQDTLKLLLSVGGLIILYNGIFQMANDAKVIEKLGFIFRPFVRWIMKDIKDESIINVVCANMIANLLGLGLATTPMALDALKRIKNYHNTNEITKEMVLLVVINVSCFTAFPLTVITLREKYNSNIGMIVWLLIIFITLITTILSIIITRWRTNGIRH